ncbi:MAG: hypothetical protein KDI24_13715 [Pseudomonadales bacterium]|nr:hypothetical protein [Pseudomonadales bacterium]
MPSEILTGRSGEIPGVLSRPRKGKTLCNTINALFTEKLSESQLAPIVKNLEQRQHIKARDGNVSYQLPQAPG